MSLLRLPQLVKIHQPNNKIFKENIHIFRQALEIFWTENESVVVRFHRGRMYLNERRLAPDKALQITIAKLGEFFEKLNFYGYRFQRVENLTDDLIIDFIKQVNLSQQQKEPAAYLNSSLEANWATPIIDKDFKIAVVMSDDGSGRFKPLIINAGVRTLAIKAKRSYSRALAVISGLNQKISDGENINISKPRRVVQDMVEGLFQNENLLLSLSTIRDYDDYTCTHCVNVAILSMCLGKRVGFNKLQVMTLGLSALFHDLGKVDVPIDLIRKTSKFTPEEYEVVKKHPLYSVLRILKINSEHTLKSKLLVSPYEHHLGIDLSGYPFADYRTTPLSLSGRIVAITDHYDALTSSRSYRPIPISPEQALDIMLQISGTELDPLLLKVFINMIGIYPVGTLLLLDSNEVGMVSETPSAAEDGRPMCVILDFDESGLKQREVVNLSEKNPKGRFKRNILRCFHPSEFGLNPSDILI
jgi:HD-GYP domain-containing protein (c-di-GMP phosphodiesterase class II)